MEVCELEEWCENEAELKCVDKEVEICPDDSEWKKERDWSVCQWVFQPVCSVVDVKKCSERPLCREMVRTVRRKVCPDSE